MPSLMCKLTRLNSIVRCHLICETSISRYRLTIPTRKRFLNKSICVISAVLFVSGCATIENKPQFFGAFDQSEKTIVVPLGASGMLPKLKQALVDESWKLSVAEDAAIVEGTLGVNTKLIAYQSARARYRLLATSQQIDTCLYPLPVSPQLRFNISVVDNKTGTEVFAFGGLDCESVIVKSFTQALKGR